MKLLAARVNDLSSVYYVIHEQGKFSTPLAILSRDEMINLINSVSDQDILAHNRIKQIQEDMRSLSLIK